MDFAPNDGFCCPFVEKHSSMSEYEPRISKFMAWVKSLPVKTDGSKRYGSASTVVPLKDQPFVIKIVEEGYAYMFQGAFAPRQGEGDTGGFDRIPYFDLITSDFEEMQFEGEASEVVVCDEHEKRYLLGLYFKAPRVTGPSSKELRTQESAPKALEEFCGALENDGAVMAVTPPVVTGREDEADTTPLVSTEPIPKYHGVHKSEERLSARKSENDTCTWL